MKRFYFFWIKRRLAPNDHNVTRILHTYSIQFSIARHDIFNINKLKLSLTTA